MSEPGLLTRDEQRRARALGLALEFVGHAKVANNDVDVVELYTLRLAERFAAWIRSEDVEA